MCAASTSLHWCYIHVGTRLQAICMIGCFYLFLLRLQVQCSWGGQPAVVPEAPRWRMKETIPRRWAVHQAEGCAPPFSSVGVQSVSHDR